MANELASLQQLIDVSSAIIEKPSLSVRDFGIERESHSQEFEWTGSVSDAALGLCPKVAHNVASSGFVGQCVVIASSVLKSFGFAALAGLGGVAAIPIVGWPAAPLIATFGLKKYRKAKKEQQEKERLYREIIKKQQAAINKLTEKIANLEVLLRQARETNVKNQQKLEALIAENANLAEIIQFLTMQNENFFS